MKILKFEKIMKILENAKLMIFLMKILFKCFYTKNESLKKFSWSLQAYKTNF